MKIKSLRKPLLAFSVCLLVSTNVRAEDNIFTGTEFLKWDQKTQEFYIHTSIGMAILIADQNDKVHGKCLNDWFAGDEQGTYNYVLKTVKRFPEFHPRGTILAVMEKKCGDFSYK